MRNKNIVYNSVHLSLISSLFQINNKGFPETPILIERKILTSTKCKNSRLRKIVNLRLSHCEFRMLIETLELHLIFRNGRLHQCDPLSIFSGALYSALNCSWIHQVQDELLVQETTSYVADDLVHI